MIVTDLVVRIVKVIVHWAIVVLLACGGIFWLQLWKAA